MIELIPAKYRDEILYCSVWAGAVMNHLNTMAKHATLIILDHVAQFLKCVTIDTCIDCGALRQEQHITDRMSHAAGFSVFLNIINTTRCVDNFQMSVNCIPAFQQNQQTWHACAPS